MGILLVYDVTDDRSFNSACIGIPLLKLASGIRIYKTFGLGMLISNNTHLKE